MGSERTLLWAGHWALVLNLTLGCAAGGQDRQPLENARPSWQHRFNRAAALQRPPDGLRTSNSYSFMVLGDTQHPTNSCTFPDLEVMAAIPRAMASTTPAPRFVLHLGDLVDFGSDANAYPAFLLCYTDILSRFPLFPTLGNHDAEWGSGMVNYKMFLNEQLLLRNVVVAGSKAPLFALFYNDDPTEYSTDFFHPTHLDEIPSGVSWRTFYAFRYQNSYFISFELSLLLWTNTPLPWVEKHLRAARSDPSIEHVFVFLHHPLYLSLKLEDDPDNGLALARKHYEPLFRQYDVTMVLSGHHHVYSHSYVPDNESSTRTFISPSTYPHDGNAVHYVVSGGGSWMVDPLFTENVERSYDYVQSIATDNHFLIIDVNGPSLAVRAIGVAGNEEDYSTSVIDSFDIIHQ